MDQSVKIANEIVNAYKDYVKPPVREALYSSIVEKVQQLLRRQALFVPGAFTAHSGAALNWKVECDALLELDWQGLVMIAEEKLGTQQFQSVIGIPRGGVAFAQALNRNSRICSGNRQDPILIVDDVWTTGKSMNEEMNRAQATLMYPDVFGLVAFARSPITTPKVLALWQ